MRAITHPTVLLAFFVLTASACSDGDVCKSARDCNPGLKCESGACVRPTGFNTTEDAGPRPDSGTVLDASADAAADAAVDLDAGPVDALADAEVSDASGQDAELTEPDGGTLGPYDSGTDGGAPTIGPLPSSGTLIFGDYESASREETGFARFVDRTGASYSVLERSVPDLEGGRCTVRTVRLSSGATQGIPAQRVTLSAQTSGQTRTLDPVAGSVGLFEPSTTLMPGFFNRSGDIIMRIETTGAAGALDNYMTYVGGPSFFSPVSPVVGTNVMVLAGIDLRWNINPAGGEQTVFVELYDARREVVLSCMTMNDGAYQVPPRATAAWYSEGPVPPATLDVGYEIVPPAADAQLLGGGQLPLSLRFQQAVRYSAQ